MHHICLQTTFYDAAIIGVGMHWCQYLAINYKVYFLIMLYLIIEKIYILVLILIYSLISMSMLGYKSNPDLITISLMIPLSGQFVHYYLDALFGSFQTIILEIQLEKGYFDTN